MLNRIRSWLVTPRPQAWPSAHRRKPEADVPPERMTRMYASLRRRLSDKIEDVLEEACVIGDLQTAEELLQVLDFMQARQPRIVGPERRRQAGRLVGLREEVERQRRVRTGQTTRPSTGFADA